MDYTGIRKLLLRFFIIFLALTALIAIVVVFANEFGYLQQRILATSFTISIASICAMACAAFIERKNMVGLGLTGLTSSGIAGVLLILVIWSFIEGDIWFKITGTFITSSFAFAHAFLLALPKLEKRYSWVQAGTALSITILALQIIFAMWLEIEAITYFRFMAAVGILVGLETLIIPILMKLNTDEVQEDDERVRLELVKRDDGTYRDSSGNAYRVSKIEPDESIDNQKNL